MTDECTVTLRLQWLPDPAGDGLSGRVVLHRTVVNAGYPGAPVTELWLSAVHDLLDLLDPPPRGGQAEWGRLLFGLSVDDISGPVRLTAADDDGRAGLARQLGAGLGNPIRPVLEVRARTRASQRTRTVASVRVARAEADLLSHTFSPVLRQTLRRMQQAPADREPPGGRGPERTTSALARIQLADVRAAQIGDHVVQVNRLVVRPVKTTLTFDEVLDRGAVVDAIARLQRRPDDRAARTALVDALSDHGWSLRARSLRLDVPAKPRTGFAELLRDSLFVQVRGAQIGDHNRQVNDIAYAVPSVPTGADLLREDRELARTLADCICPRSTGERDVAHLQGRLRDTVAALPVAWHDGRIRGLHAYPPGEGEVLRIQHADGVVIGRDVKQVTTTRTDAVAVRARPPRYLGAVRAPEPGRTSIMPADREPATADVERARLAASRAADVAEAAREALDQARTTAERALLAAERAVAKAIVAGDVAQRDGTAVARAAADRMADNAKRARVGLKRANNEVELAARVTADAKLAVAAADRAVAKAEHAMAEARRAVARERELSQLWATPVPTRRIGIQLGR
jgi:hypothetical protein